jgi:hypothetical protein
MKPLSPLATNLAPSSTPALDQTSLWNLWSTGSDATLGIVDEESSKLRENTSRAELVENEASSC